MEDDLPSLPRDLEAERGVLSGLLVNPSLCDEVAMRVKAEDFFDTSHAEIFSAVMGLWNDGKNPDLPLILKRVKASKLGGDVNWAVLLKDIFESGSSAVNALHYASMVAGSSAMRSLVQAGSSIAAIGMGDDTPEQAVSRAEQLIFRIGERRASVEVHKLDAVMGDLMASLERRWEAGRGVGLPTGFFEFDKLTGGLRPGELIIVAGRPSSGKTALGLNIAAHASMIEGKTCLLTSLEMSRLECAERMVCSQARVGASSVREGRASLEDRRKLVVAQSEFSQAELFIDDEPQRTMSQIAATARRQKRRGGLDLLVIDYLQLITPDNPRDPRQEQVSTISRKLKHLARELELPVICLAQLNRQAEATANKRPQLSHLRESGAIEQDADMVLFVHREEYYATDEKKREELKGQADLIIGKNRNGPVGEVKLTWAASWTRFENAPHHPANVDPFAAKPTYTPAPRGGQDFASQYAD